MFERHELVWLDPTAIGLFEGLNAVEDKLVSDWLNDQRPAVVRRNEGLLSRHADYLAVGIPLPDRLGRKRISFVVPVETVLRRDRMPLLQDASICAPEHWQSLLTEMSAIGRQCGAQMRIYGSLGWQYLTHESYLRPESDLDLLILPLPAFTANEALPAFKKMAAHSAPRLDGEFVLGPDRAVSWRELCSTTGEVLVRSRGGLVLLSRASVLASLTPEERA